MAVHKNKNGVWYFKVYVDTMNKDGEVVRKPVRRESINWDRNEARRQERLFLNNYDINDVDILKLTFLDLYEEYLSFKKARVSPATLKELCSVYSNHLKRFDDLKLSSFNRRLIERWQTSLLSLTHNGKPYENNTLQKIQITFFAILRYGISHNYLNNLGRFTYVKHFALQNQIRNYITEDEFKQFFSVVENIEEKAFFSLLYFTGLRIGEAVGLKFEDVDLNKRLLHVRRSVNRQEVAGLTKTKRSLRSVTLPSVLIDYLRDYIDHLDQISLDDYFFINFRKRTTITKRKDFYFKKSKVHRISIHGFRHSHVSFMINHDFSAFDIAARIGDTVDMVYKVYGHMFDSRKSELVNRIDEIWNGPNRT